MNQKYFHLKGCANSVVSILDTIVSNLDFYKKQKPVVRLWALLYVDFLA